MDMCRAYCGRVQLVKEYLSIVYKINGNEQLQCPPSSQRQLSNAGTYMLLMRAPRGRYDAVELWGSLLVVNWEGNGLESSWATDDRTPGSLSKKLKLAQ